MSKVLSAFRLTQCITERYTEGKTKRQVNTPIYKNNAMGEKHLRALKRDKVMASEDSSIT